MCVPTKLQVIPSFLLVLQLLAHLKVHFFKAALKSKRVTRQILLRTLAVNKCWKRPIVQGTLTSNSFQRVHFNETVIPSDSDIMYFF